MSGEYIILIAFDSTLSPYWLALHRDVRIEPRCITSLMSLSIWRQTAKTASCLSLQAFLKWLALLYLETFMCWHFIVAKNKNNCHMLHCFVFFWNRAKMESNLCRIKQQFGTIFKRGAASEMSLYSVNSRSVHLMTLHTRWGGSHTGE